MLESQWRKQRCSKSVKETEMLESQWRKQRFWKSIKETEILVVNKGNRDSRSQWRKQRFSNTVEEKALSTSVKEKIDSQMNSRHNDLCNLILIYVVDSVISHFESNADHTYLFLTLITCHTIHCICNNSNLLRYSRLSLYCEVMNYFELCFI